MTHLNSAALFSLAPNTIINRTNVVVHAYFQQTNEFSECCMDHLRYDSFHPFHCVIDRNKNLAGNDIKNLLSRKYAEVIMENFINIDPFSKKAFRRNAI